MKKSTVLKGVNRSRPRIFIGSSVEGIDVANAMQSAIYFDTESVMWNQGIFSPAVGTLEALDAEVNAFDFAAFVLTPDDFIRKRNQHGYTIRDNVLLEIGIFIGKLGRNRVFLVHCCSDNLILPSDLAGVNMVPYLIPSESKYLISALSLAKMQIINTIHDLGPRSRYQYTNSSQSNYKQQSATNLRSSLISRHHTCVTKNSNVNKGVKTVTVDGKLIVGNLLHMFKDGKTHRVKIFMR
jgi:hypothetical protein